jgi:hypothetical protein
MRGTAVEDLTRRCNFQPGRAIRLADGQEWVFPCPASGSDRAFGHADEEYHGLLRAIREAADERERLLCELAIAIFLLRLNYTLTAEDLEFLFTFPSGSSELRESQRQFRSLAAQHRRYFGGAAFPASEEDERAEPPRPSAVSLLPRLRTLWRSRRWPMASGQGEVLS